VFKLRKDVTFHDGKPLTPADVVFSIMRHKDAATASRAKVLADQIESVTASGPERGDVPPELAQRRSAVILGTYHFHIVKAGTTDFNAGIGTGPYKVKEFKPGVRSIAVRNENYWKPNRPYLDEIELVGITDESARVNALLAGQLDLIQAVSPRSVERVTAGGKHAVYETKSVSYTNLIMRRDSSPGNNPDFVLAMKHLFNREQLLKSIQLGRGVVANDQPIASSNRFYFKGLPQRPYDPEKAKWHLQKANLGSTAIPVVVSPAATNSVEMALVMQHAAKQIGLNLDVKRMPADGYWSTHWMKHPVGFGNVNARPSADLALTLFFKSDAPWNEAAWKNEKFDQLLVAARGEVDQAKRAQMYADMQVLIHNEGGIGIPMFVSSLDGHNSKLKGLSPIPISGMMGSSFAEHVWLDGLTRVHRDERLLLKLLVQRIGLACLSLLAVSVVVFAVTGVLPGDAAQEQLARKRPPSRWPRCVHRWAWTCRPPALPELARAAWCAATWAVRRRPSCRWPSSSPAGCPTRCCWRP
jgi:peptide/nickel transport system substrate-binding protein